MASAQHTWGILLPRTYVHKRALYSRTRQVVLQLAVQPQRRYSVLQGYALRVVGQIDLVPGPRSVKLVEPYRAGREPGTSGCRCAR
jgi:hypothetical protein